jgi:hypothetical protein
MKAAESIFMNHHVAKKFKDEKWSIQLILMQTLKNTGGKPGLAWEHT